MLQENGYTINRPPRDGYMRFIRSSRHGVRTLNCCKTGGRLGRRNPGAKPWKIPATGLGRDHRAAFTSHCAGLCTCYPMGSRVQAGAGDGRMDVSQLRFDAVPRDRLQRGRDRRAADCPTAGGGVFRQRSAGGDWRSMNVRGAITENECWTGD